MCRCRVDLSCSGYYRCWIWRPESDPGNGILLQYEAKGNAGPFLHRRDRPGDPFGYYLPGDKYTGKAEGRFPDKEQKRSRPIEEKENFRWLDSMRETLLRMPADIPILTVCDREGDFYEFFSEAADLKANFLIRIVQNRMVDDGKRSFMNYVVPPVAGSNGCPDEPESQRAYPSRNIKMDSIAKRLQSTVLKGERKKHLREMLS